MPMRGTLRMRRGLERMIEDIPGGGLSMVEVGSWHGESAVIFAASGKFSKIYCVDPWDKTTIMRGKIFDGRLAEREFDKRTSIYPEITKLKSWSVLEAGNFSPDGVDLVYIDGNHDYEFVKQDIEAWLPVARRWIAGHDFAPDYPGVILAVTQAFTCPIKLFWDTSWLVDLKDKS